jgi:hypothetical protein
MTFALQPLSRTHRQMHWVYGRYVMPSTAALTAGDAWAAFGAGDAL